MRLDRPQYLRLPKTFSLSGKWPGRFPVLMAVISRRWLGWRARLQSQGETVAGIFIKRTALWLRYGDALLSRAAASPARAESGCGKNLGRSLVRVAATKPLRIWLEHFHFASLTKTLMRLFWQPTAWGPIRFPFNCQDEDLCSAQRRMQFFCIH